MKSSSSSSRRPSAQWPCLRKIKSKQAENRLWAEATDNPRTEIWIVPPNALAPGGVGSAPRGHGAIGSAPALQAGG